jgi:oligoendopeptidase F
MEVKTEWDLKGLFGYDDYKDPQIEKDVKKGIRQIKAFAKKWSDREDWLSDPAVLREALDEYFEPTNAGKALYYLSSLSTKETLNTELQSILAKYSDSVSKVAESNLFFTIKLGKLDKKNQKDFLRSKELKSYNFWLKKLFAEAKYDLTEDEERIISRYSRPKSTLWIETLQKTLNEKTINHKGKKLSQSEAAARVSLEKNTKARRALNNKLYQAYADLGNIAEGSYNATLLNRKISNELRGYKKPYSATVMSYQNTEKEVEELVEVVKSAYKISHDYYKLKSEVLNLDDFSYADRNVDVGKVKKKFSYQNSVEVVKEVLTNFNIESANAFGSLINNGQYDAFPKKGKRGGAYMNSVADQPTLVFLNHVDGFDAMMTLAHETGHALHTYFTDKNQPFHYQGYPISTAEVASTFIENLVFYDQLPKLTEKEQFSALMGKMNNMVNTVQRQVAFFEIERRLHESILDQGHISQNHMQQILISELKDQLGRHVLVEDKIGNLIFMMAQAHFSNPFYVYAYAYGELIAQALYRLYQDDQVKGEKAIINFMSAGSSAKPKIIFRKSGVMVGKELWEEGLDVMRSDLRKLKRLNRKLNK